MGWITYAFLAALAAAVVGVLSKVGIAGIDATLATAIRGLSIAVFMGGAALFFGKWGALASTSPKTLFFIVLTGGATAGTLSLAWGYVGSRVVHSIVQATINKVVVRFLIFAFGSLLLVCMTVRELIRVLG